MSVIARKHQKQMDQHDLISGNIVHRTDAATLAAFQSVLLTSVAFVATGLPRFIVILAPVGYIPHYLNVIMMWLNNANSILNTVIYGYKFKEFRMVAKKLMCRKICLNKVNDDPNTVKTDSTLMTAAL